MNTPGISHVILTVSDLDRAKQFYGDLLGFEVKTIPPEYGPLAYFAVNETSSVWLMTHDGTPEGDRFDERRIGLDHLAFAAPDADALHTLAGKLIAAGVDTKGVEKFHNRWLYIAFRDPDNIQLEYWLDTPIEDVE